jgi:hypothetical protein
MNARVLDQQPPAADAPVESEFDALLRNAARPETATRPGTAGQPALEQERARDASAARMGRIVSLDEQGTLKVLVAGTEHAVPARLAAALTTQQVADAIGNGQPAVLVFENGNPLRPLIVGLLQPGPLAASDGALPAIDADVDGRRVRLTAREEIVLECGEASVTLRRNGRIVIRGTHVESSSEGTNRIKGGVVRIN